MASPNLSEIVTTTLRNRSRTLSDNVSNHNALLRRLRENGNQTSVTGRDIVRELEYADNGSCASISNNKLQTAHLFT